ncbi:MAG: Rieske (2Fe-2S) protein [Actinomycetota bacterium]|nr:Rieske (2Fe-2S) protein [Actinomycetota bacterium]
METQSANFVRAARLEDVRAAGQLPVRAAGHSLALFFHDGRVHAVDNRCPHMGFPLHRGSVRDGILTCHWHHARFDLQSGGTFDQFADEARVFPVEIRDDEVWVDLAPREDRLTYLRQRLHDGLERNISLVIAKSAIGLLNGGEDPAEPFRTGLDFGARYRRAGWGQGLTMHACMMNLLPHLGPEDSPLALYHGLSAVSRDCAGEPPRFTLRPLPAGMRDMVTLKVWFRRFVEVRDSEGAERCIVSAVRAGADHVQMADMLFAAATDHRYVDVGHVLDFTNKALEALDIAGWSFAEPVLSSLARGYAGATRMEESNSWRNPVDLVEILADAFDRLPDALESGRDQRGRWKGPEELASVLLDENPGDIVEALLGALREGATEEELAGAVAYAAALRIARFPTTNEFGDWDTALHTFTFANAVHQGLRRSASPELLRGVFDAAMSVHLDRFLNVPAARLPEPDDPAGAPEELLAELPTLLDERQRVDSAGKLAASYLHGGGDSNRLLAVVGGLLLREDRNFHTIQAVEAAFRQHALLRGTAAGAHVLIAAVRYLAAHSPTMRSQGQTYDIARRLSRGEILYEE